MVVRSIFVEAEWSSGRDLFLDLDRGRGLRNGIEHSLREAMRDGRLTAGCVLPSSRSLARDLGLARGTVSAAYSQLAAEGYLESRQGAPTRVCWQPRRRLPPPSAPPVPGSLAQWDFRPGRPDSASFPRQDWLRACRRVMTQVPDDAFGYGAACGSARLRRVLADYLGRARGVDTDAGRLLICNGFTQALMLVCRVLRGAGAASLAVEDPAAPRYRRLAQAEGLSVVPVGCDQDGLLVDELERSDAAAVLVTPAHQYPLGVTMTAGRRTALAGWARRRNALIIEDDYDGEFRYDRQPLGALQRLDPERVIYVGSASKTLAPALRLGWLSLPSAIRDALTAAKEELDRGSAVTEQLTLAELIQNGSFDRHVRRMRERYRRRRDQLAHAVAEVRPELRLAGISAGLHAVIHLPGQLPSESEIQALAARHSIALHTLGGYWHTPPTPCPRAVVIGYATPASHAYQPALSALTQLLAAI
jgi:GntR family transcriptional regulator / MocR family aminotransferase